MPFGVLPDSGEFIRTASRAGQAFPDGTVAGLSAAGIHPAIHRGWLEALALGYRVAVRPSRREPLMPHRLVTEHAA